MRAWSFKEALEAEGFIWDYDRECYLYNGECFDYKEALEEIAISQNLCKAYDEKMFISESDFDFSEYGWVENGVFNEEEIRELYCRYCDCEEN